MHRGSISTLEKLTSLSIECVDCGRLRWRKPSDLYRIKGVGPATDLSELGMRLVCTSCQNEGMDGRNIAIQANFNLENDRLRFEAARISSQAIRAKG